MIELHAHLSGSTPFHFALSHASDQGREDLVGELISHQSHFEDTRALLGADFCESSIRPSAALDDFLGRWFPVLEELGDDLAFLESSAAEIARRFKNDAKQLYHLELRFCPFLRRAPAACQIDAVRRGLASVLGKNCDVVVIGIRGNRNHLELMQMPEILARASGFDVAGRENGIERDDSWLQLVTKTYRMAQQAGLYTTYHIGETGPAAFWKVMTSEIPLDRIGHGYHGQFVPGWYKLRGSNMPMFELCPTINHITKTAPFRQVVEFAEKLQTRGIKFCFGSDNPAISGVSLFKQREYIEYRLDAMWEMERLNDIGSGGVDRLNMDVYTARLIQLDRGAMLHALSDQYAEQWLKHRWEAYRATPHF